LKGIDEKKDQSYFLFSLTQKELARIVFPVGDHTKDEVRRIAKEAGLPTSDKSESQEICFIPDNDYPSFVEAQDPRGLRGAGNFITVDGKVLGRHKGIHNYTIGQRRGLGFGVGSRQYVVEIRPEQNEVVLGSKNDLLKMEMIVRDVSWVGPDALGDVEVKIRSTHGPAKARIKSLGGDGVGVVFFEPQGGIAPGQAAVFYRGEEVLGGGWIA
jgi:tRNA-specific 2-thiouridylase